VRRRTRSRIAGCVDSPRQCTVEGSCSQSCREKTSLFSRDRRRAEGRQHARVYLALVYSIPDTEACVCVACFACFNASLIQIHTLGGPKSAQTLITLITVSDVLRSTCTALSTVIIVVRIDALSNKQTPPCSCNAPRLSW
jgi:hypothetical protein